MYEQTGLYRGLDGFVYLEEGHFFNVYSRSGVEKIDGFF